MSRQNGPIIGILPGSSSSTVHAMQKENVKLRFHIMDKYIEVFESNMINLQINVAFFPANKYH